MTNTRKRHPSEFKTRVVLDVLSNTGTLIEIASKHGLHPTMISSWKTEFLRRSKEIFADPRKKDDGLREKEEALDEAHRQIGQLTIERDWLKKKYKQLG
jgi:putative transposase